MNSRVVAFVCSMAAMANMLGLLTIHLWIVNVHFTQLPVILTGLSMGPIPGGLVGFFGFMISAFTLPRANPYILGGNAILGFFTGLFYSKLCKKESRPLIPQAIAVVGAYLLQAPYVFVTDVYLMGMPAPVVLAIMGVLLVENIVSVFICHVVLYRVDIRRVLSK